MLTDVILMTFRANGLLLAAGDEIAGEEGLTSARWQVLSAVEMAGKPLTVPQIACRMGLQFIEVDERVPFLSQLQSDTGPIMLINRLTVAGASVAALVAAWADDAAWMRQQPG